MRPTILIVDDHELIREGLRRVIERRGDWEVCGEAANGQEALELVGRLNPDLVILDFAMQGLNGLATARKILDRSSSTRILLLTGHQADELVRDAFRAGVRGFVLKADAGSHLILAIEAVLGGKPYFSGGVSEFVLNGFLAPGSSSADAAGPGRELSVREREVIRLVAEGMSSKMIADALGISARTVETHRNHLLRRLKLNSTVELVRYAIRNGIVQA